MRTRRIGKGWLLLALLGAACAEQGGAAARRDGASSAPTTGTQGSATDAPLVEPSSANGSPAVSSPSGPTTSPSSADRDAAPPAVTDAGVVSTPQPRACCASHAEGGCDDASVRACVCAGDPRCCSERWDDVCVALVTALGCGSCKGECCVAGVAPGCTEPAVERCVCDKSPECCSERWDEFCALLVSTETSAGSCGACQ